MDIAVRVESSDGMKFVPGIKPLILVLALSLAAAAEPSRARLSGPVQAGVVQSERLIGKLRFSRHGEISALIAKLELVNRGKTPVFYSVQLMLTDDRGRLLASDSFTQLIAMPAGKSETVHFELAMPRAELARAKRYQLVIYDDTTLLGTR